MRTKLIAATAVALGLSTASAFAQAGAGTTTVGAHTCLWTYQIDHTHYVKPQTVMFYMKDGHVWQNDLRGPCPGLNFHGFSFVSNSDRICGPEIGIRVIRTGEVCSLGEFSPAPGMHASR